MAENIEKGGRYNFWIVVEKADSTRCSDMWVCECRCGRRRRLSGYRLIRYKNKEEINNGCGFCESERYEGHPRIIVNGKRIPVYGAWCNMRKRCFDPKHRLYGYYGGRGIVVCDEWNESFLCFYEYVSKLPHFGEPGRSLDRIDNDKGYFPGNVRWATAKEQANNQRKRRGRSEKRE